MNKNTTKIELTFPAGEFRAKDLIAQNNLSQPIVYTKIKEAMASGKIKEVRRQRNESKGRPFVIYSLV